MIERFISHLSNDLEMDSHCLRLSPTNPCNPCGLLFILFLLYLLFLLVYIKVVGK